MIKIITYYEEKEVWINPKYISYVGRQTNYLYEDEPYTYISLVQGGQIGVKTDMSVDEVMKLING